MNLNRKKFVRFQDWSSEKSEDFTDEGFYGRKIRPFVSSIMKGIVSGYEKGYERIIRFKKPLSYSDKKSRSKMKILDPQDPCLQKWNKIFVLLCAFAVSLDPLFLYIPVINDEKKCLDLDRPLGIVACILRSLVDLFYLLHMIFKFRTGFIAPSSRVFGRGELVDDPLVIAKRYLTSFFIIDVLSILPLPQWMIFIVIPQTKGPVSLVTKDMLKLIIFCQYVPRLVRIFPLYKEIARTSGVFTETAWAGAAFNLFLYMLASHVIGAFWYLFSIERAYRCWFNSCKGSDCSSKFLYCTKDGEHTAQYAFLNSSCPLLKPDDITNPATFNFGIFFDALESRVVGSKDFLQKFFYCFWWGLRSLSSLGQNLKTSTFVWEIVFAITISVAGLVLFALLIGNMQKYLESTTVRVEEMRVKRRDAEQWMSHRMLPQELKERIRQYEQYKWQVTRGVEEEELIRTLPKDIRRDIKRHLCLELVKRVPMFEKMDEQLLDAMCDRLKPVLYTEKSFIFREGDPCDEMLFIMRGTLVTMTTYGGKTGFFNSVYLKAGDVCGEGLFTWALDPQSTNLPLSTRTVQALTEVEAFSLMADDFKCVASQFRRLHSKQLQHTFRFYSVQWKTWAACFIQEAWRQHCRRKLNKSLREAENRLQDALAKESGTSPSLGATLYASRFAANVLKTLRQKNVSSSRLSHRLTPLLPKKPTEPDFSVEDR